MEQECANHDLAALFNFAVWMAGDRAAGLRHAADVVRAHPTLGLDGWLAAAFAAFAEPRGLDRRLVLDTLDHQLRTDLTVSVLDHPAVQGETRRRNLLQWHLKRTCLWTVLRALTLQPRAVFVMTHVLGLARGRIADILGIHPHSVDIALARGQHTVEGYLEPRCQHLGPRNPCRCATRLGIALSNDVITWPEHPDELPADKPAFIDAYRAAGPLYAGLPRFLLDGQSAAMLNTARLSGASLS